MPMHNWARVKSGIYHNFHFRWIAAIMDRLNAGLLPAGYFAMAEQIIGQPESDVVALETFAAAPPRPGSEGGVATMPVRSQTRFVVQYAPETQCYARKTHRVVVRHELGKVVAVVEVVSPGNKDRQHSLRTFVDKCVDLLDQQVNLLIIDPFPPGAYDVGGIHQVISAVYADKPFELPADKPLTFVAYQVSPLLTAYVEPIAVGDPLPNMPLFSVTTRAPTCRWKRRIKPPGGAAPRDSSLAGPSRLIISTRRRVKHKTTNRREHRPPEPRRGVFRRWSACARSGRQLRAIALRNASRSGQEAANRTRPFSCFSSSIDSISSTRSRGTSPNRASRNVTMCWLSCPLSVSRVFSITISSRNGTSSMTFFTSQNRQQT